MNSDIRWYNQMDAQIQIAQPAIPARKHVFALLVAIDNVAIKMPNKNMRGQSTMNISPSKFGLKFDFIEQIQ